MQFASVKAMLRWYYHGFKYRERPYPLKAIDYQPRCQNRYNNYQDPFDVIITHMRVKSALDVLPSEDEKILKEYYRTKEKKHTKLQGIVQKVTGVRRMLEKIEDKLLEPCNKLELLFTHTHEQPLYAPDKPTEKTHLLSVREICNYLNRSDAWFYNKGIKNRSLQKIVKKLDGRWEAKVEELKLWRDEHRGDNEDDSLGKKI